MKPGLASVTFRQLEPQAIVRLAQEAGLEVVEWAADVHIRPGDFAAARTLRRLCEDAGLKVLSYGSYWRLGELGQQGSRVMETAAYLGAEVVRVWAGVKSPREATARDWRRVADAAFEAAEMADMLDLRVALEFHGGTLTETGGAARQLLAAAFHPRLGCLWQPSIGARDEECLADLDAILPHLEHVHVFHWLADYTRLPLVEGKQRWKKFLRRIAEGGKDPALLLEFVPGDDPAVLPREAGALKALAREFSGSPRE